MEHIWAKFYGFTTAENVYHVPTDIIKFEDGQLIKRQ